MNIKILAENEMFDIYNTYMVNDFPQSEMKPFEVIKDLMKRGLYFAYGLFEGDVLKAYAFLCSAPNSEYALLDYLAVCSNDRGKGYGSECLSMLKQECADFAGILIEVEDTDYAVDEASRNIRQKRISFYEKNGTIHTNVLCDLLGEHMQILVLSIADRTDDNTKLRKELDNIYDALFAGSGLRDRVITEEI